MKITIKEARQAPWAKSWFKGSGVYDVTGVELFTYFGTPFLLIRKGAKGTLIS